MSDIINDNYIFQMINISKYFHNGQLKANDKINLSVRPNEIHAIIGENGAGKSTLMSILFGLYEPDEGEIYIRNERVKFKSSKDASKYSIGMVHQHFTLVDNYSILDNIILGSEPIKNKIFIDRKKAIEKINKLNEKYEFNFDLSKKVSSLTVFQQQKVEILKVLFRDSEIIIFDEPTAVLSDKEIDLFLDMVLLLKKLGKTIILISHKLYEIKKVAETVTVLYKGRSVAVVKVADKSISELAELMVGKKVVETKTNGNILSEDIVLEVNNLDLNYAGFSKTFSQKITKFLWKILFFISKKVLRLKNVNFNLDESSSDEQKREVSFKIRSGEIFAVAGVDGNGQDELIQFLTGFKKGNKDAIKINDLKKSNNNKAIAYHKLAKKMIAFVPADRHKHGLVLDETCRLNFVNNSIDKEPFSKFGIIQNSYIAQYSNELISKFDVRGASNGAAIVRELSGGNQQKLIIAREFSRGLNLLIFVQPTRGLDMGAVEYIYSEIIQAKNSGAAILLISYELDEILALADTIAVMSRKKIVGIGSREEMTRKKIGVLLAGGDD